MKACDVVSQIKSVLGGTSTRYGDCLTAATVTNIGTVATYIFDEPHKLKSSQGVVVSGVGQLFNILTLVVANDILSVQVTAPHDLTEDDPARPNIMLTGTGVPELDNVEIPLGTVPNRLTFTCDVSSLNITPVEVLNQGSLVELYSSAFNGQYPVQVLDPNTMTIDVATANVPVPLDETAILTSQVCLQTRVRVTACVTEERFFDAYTKQEQDDVWLVVVLGDQAISRDRAILSDGNQVKAAGNDRWLREFQEFNVYAVMPATDSLLGSDASDLAFNEIKADLYRALVGWKPNSEYKCPQKYAVTPVSNGASAYKKSYYAHRYTFEVATEITAVDQFQPSGDRAFRDIDFSLDGFFFEEQPND